MNLDYKAIMEKPSPLDSVLLAMETIAKGGDVTVSHYPRPAGDYPLPTRAQLAEALRAAAVFCRDDESPKSPGAMAIRKLDDRALSVAPFGGGATHWCAVGRCLYELAEPNEGVLFAAFEKYRVDAEAIYETFDDLDYAAAASVLDQAAAFLESGETGARFRPVLDAAFAS